MSQLDRCLKFKPIRGDKNDCTLHKITPRILDNYPLVTLCMSHQFLIKSQIHMKISNFVIGIFKIPGKRACYGFLTILKISKVSKFWPTCTQVILEIIATTIFRRILKNSTNESSDFHSIIRLVKNLLPSATSSKPHTEHFRSSDGMDEYAKRGG